MFEIGTVLRLYANDLIPPKVKYCIIVGNSSDKIATVFINTELRYQDLTSELQALQYPLTPDDCRCLRYESYADCAEIRERDKSELNTILQKDPGRKECILSEAHTKAIVNIVKGAKTISPAEKKKFSLL